jgi:CCR4-NOT transcription complex subunit 7/8
VLNPVQIGFSFANRAGGRPKGTHTWQFNLAFNMDEDMYAQDSIDLLTRSGIDFALNEKQGIDVLHFGELLMVSGLVLMDNIKWISFHSG